MSKQEWTIAFNVTRKFTLRSRPVLKIVLRDAGGEYAAEVPYRMVLPDESEVESKLNAAGYAKGSSKVPGLAEVIFPEHSGQVRCDHPGVQRAGDSFFCPTSKVKYEFRVVEDVSDQVDTLLRAAAIGTAFCEKCEARRAEAAA